MFDNIEMYSIHDKEKVKLGTALAVSYDTQLFELLMGARERTLMDLITELDN